MPQAHLLTGAVDTDIYPTPPLGMRAVNQRLLFPLKKEIQKPYGFSPKFLTLFAGRPAGGKERIAVDVYLIRRSGLTVPQGACQNDHTRIIHLVGACA